LRLAYVDAKLLWAIACERWWCDRVRMNDVSHLSHEWNFELPSERERYARILAAIARFCGSDNWGDALEVGCAEGLFTQLLGPRCDRLLACDISAVACRHTAERCHLLAQVSVKQLDLDNEAIPGQYDMVLAMDVLEFIHGRRRLQTVLEKLAKAVRPGGLLIFSGCRLPEELRHRWWMALFPEGADNIVGYLKRGRDLRALHEEEHSQSNGQSAVYLDHLIAIFRKS
jgi:2-polyprenyl-3-methyl-5-hydroxy-6-metoxy-1,4-benzoquinol methylase